MSRSLVLLFLLVFALDGPESALAQETRVLTLSRAVDMAQANSPAARISRLDLRQAEWQHRSFRAGFLPGITLSGNAPGLERSIADILQDDGSIRYVSQSRTFSRVGLSVVQPIALTGGQIFMSSGLSRVDLFGAQDSRQWQSSPLVVGFSQPLFQHNAMRWDRELEPIRHRRSQRRFVADLAHVAVDVARRFFDVVIAQMDVERAEFNVAVNDTIYTLSEGRFDIGSIAENDLLQSELALLNARTDLSERRIEYDRALQDLKIALDLPPDADVDVVAPLSAPELNIDPQEAVELARRNRADFLELELQVLESEQNLARTRAQSSWSADLTASYGLNQSSEYLDEVYQRPLNQQRFSLGFTVPVFHWGESRANVESALAEQRRTEEAVALRKKELDQEVYFETLRLTQLRRQLDLAAKADTIAARRFEVARNRYTIGKIDITELFIAQQAKDEANQAYVRTLQQFWVSYFRLRRLTLHDFDAGTPLGQ